MSRRPIDQIPRPLLRRKGWTRCVNQAKGQFTNSQCAPHSVVFSQGTDQTDNRVPAQYCTAYPLLLRWRNLSNERMVYSLPTTQSILYFIDRGIDQTNGDFRP
jgi:hypothetical protein